MNILKYVFLIMAIVYGFSNITKVIYKKSITSPQLLFMAIGIVGFISIQFNI